LHHAASRRAEWQYRPLEPSSNFSSVQAASLPHASSAPKWRRKLASVAERRERGKAARESAPRSAHGDWSPASDRPDPVELIADQDVNRVDFLVPIRHQRMSQSAFAFYRGTAAIMAADLSKTPASGISVQACGDAHLSNFGGFASPERDLVFDVNDFDETLRGPWEWDLKRLTASLILAGRHLGAGKGESRGVAAEAIRSYRSGMRKHAGMTNLEVWYDKISADDVRDQIGPKEARKRLKKGIKKAERRNSLRAFSKLAEVVDGRPQIRSDPPLLIPLRDLSSDFLPDQWEDLVKASLEAYRETLSDELRALLDRYEMVDVALKVVGVGSVGTRCFVVLFVGRDEGDPLFLQVKEAGGSVLESALPSSRYRNSGRRVVEGQRLMQAFGDVFLGWSTGLPGRDFYWRQLKDMKASADIDAMDAATLTGYGRLCGWTLARAHSRAGDGVAIAAYLGSSDTFGDAVVRFSEAYADQAESDFSAFVGAIEAGRLSSRSPEKSPVQE
jgi:uncharacterized protein (DUF2252 family)